MRPTKAPMFIQQKNPAGSVTRYCPTPPLPPSVTDKPWWERLRDGQPNSQPRSDVESGDSGNPKRWTWTLVQTQHNGGSRRHHLRRSPEGKLLINEELIGKPYVVITKDDYRPESPNAEPEDRLFSADEARIQDLSRPIANAQIGPQTFVAVYTLPNGQPELPGAYVESHRVVQKRDGSWCFLPRAYGHVPESWYTPYDDFADRPATGIAGGAQSSNVKSQVSEAPADTSSVSQIIEPIQPSSVSTTNVLPTADETKETKETKEVQDTSPSGPPMSQSPDLQITGSPDPPIPKSSDHPITGSPDHPISSPAQQLEKLEKLISAFLVCSDDQRAILALWILHTYCYRASSTTPYLNIFSPVEESGKSVCLGVLRGLCAQPWWASGVPSSTLTRKIIADRPTVLLDNWHTTFRGSDKQQITGFLLTGCRNFQPFSLMEGSSRSGFCTREVEVFCPKAFAGMSSLPPTLAQRSIPIVLQRRKPHQIVSPVVALLHQDITRPFTSWMEDWARDHLLEVRNNTIDTDHGKSLLGLSPHQQDSAQALLGLAETIGGHWLQKARVALLNIFREQAEKEASSVQLLSDVRDAFAHHHHPERIFTAEILEYLHSLDHRTWNEWSKGQPMTAQALSTLLRKPFNISSRSQRRGSRKARGYQQADFADAWERYLPTHKDGDQQMGRPDQAKAAPAPGKSQPPKPTEETQPEAAKPKQTRRKPKHPDRDQAQAQSAFPPIKMRSVSTSQFKAGWAKGRSLLKQFAGKTLGLFAATRT